LPARPKGSGGGNVGRIEVVGEDIRVKILRLGDGRPRDFLISQFVISRDDVRLTVDATIDLPGDIGDSVTLSAIQLLTEGDETPAWDVTVEADDIELAGVSTLHTTEFAKFGSGRGDFEVSLVVADGIVASATADLDFDDVGAEAAAGFSIAGRLEFLNDDDGWLLEANSFRLETENGIWPLSTLRVEASTSSEKKIDTLNVRASYLKLTDASVFRPWLKPEHQKLLSSYAPDGLIRNLEATVGDFDSDLPRFNISASFERIGTAAVGKIPGVRGFSGALRADQSGGRLEIDSGGLSVHLPNYLPELVLLDEASGTLIWRRSNNRTTLLSDSIVLRNEDFRIETNVEMSLADNSRRPIVDLAATFSINDIYVAKKYIPYIPRIPRTSEWFQEGMLAGSIPRGTVRLYGPMDKWPFDGGEGRFLVEANMRDALILYQRRWPPAEIIDLDIVVDNMRLYTERNSIINVGNEVTDARIEIGDFRSPILTISLDTAGPLESVRSLLAQSPIGTDVLNGNLERITVTGDGAFNLDMKIPIRDWQSFEFTARLQTNDASLEIDGFPAPLTELGGVVTIEREDVSSESLVGVLLGNPITIDLQPAPDTMPDYRIIATAEGAVTAEALVSELGIPLGNDMSGATDFVARLFFARGEQEVPAPFKIEIASDLGGLAIDLPEPLSKPVDETMALAATIRMPPNVDIIESAGIVDGLLSWQLGFTKEEDLWDLKSGVVAFGNEAVETMDTRGLHLRGRAEYVNMQEWFDRTRASDSQTGMGDRIRSIDMTIGSLHLLGQHIIEHQIRVDRGAQGWSIEFNGADIVGTASVPYDFTAGLPIVVEMDRLVLPGNEESPVNSDTEIDPRSLPPITIKAAEFAIGTRFFGSVEATLERTADGLETNNLVTRDNSFDIVGSGRWVIDESDPTGFHSFLTATMTSKDVEETMTRLDYDPGIVSDDFAMQLDLDWSGGPRDDFKASLNGDVDVRIGTGQLSDVEPGAGRMFGLVSVVALPRRLALDFRDVFGKGFGFDKISGKFRIDNGQTFTCNLSLEGPAAAIGIVGRAGLVERDYDQTAVVSASFGNALPIVAAALGGPQVAAVMLIFSQIFKKPLQEVSQIYYGISGSWDDPVIESVTAEVFAEQGMLAGCIDGTE
jgi:uncharacterized protein (TIGR02099 family)